MITAILNWDEGLTEKANHLIGHSFWFDRIISILSVGLVYLVPLILLGVWFYSSHTKKQALQMLFSGLLAWFVFNGLFARFVWTRPRPYIADMVNIRELIFHRPTYSFPSDHAALFAALVCSAWLLGFKKLGWWFFAMGVTVGITRVIIGVHYPLDILAGIVFGALAAFILQWLKKPLTRFVYDPIIKVAQKIHLV